MKPSFLKISLFFIITICFTLSLHADELFKEGSHYKRVTSAQPGSNDKQDKIEIIEFFLYSCKHCYELEPKLKSWLDKNKNKVTFKRVPAVITPSWVPLAKAYYVAEKLNILNKTHIALFKSIHEDKIIYLNEYKLSEFYEKHGVEPADFIREFNSKEVVDKVSKARLMSVNYDFRGVPAVIINDEFKTAPFYTRNQEQMLDVIDYLIAEISAR